MLRLRIQTRSFWGGLIVTATISIILALVFSGEDVGVLGPTQAMSRVIAVLGIVSFAVGAFVLLWRLPRPAFFAVFLLVMLATLMVLDHIFGGRPTPISRGLLLLFFGLRWMLALLTVLLPAVPVIVIVLIVALALFADDDASVEIRRDYIAVAFFIVGGFLVGGSLRYEFRDVVATYVHNDQMYAARVYYGSSDPDLLRLLACNRLGFNCAPIFEGDKGSYRDLSFSIVPNEAQDGFVLVGGTQTFYTHHFDDGEL